MCCIKQGTYEETGGAHIRAIRHHYPRDIVKDNFGCKLMSCKDRWWWRSGLDSDAAAIATSARNIDSREARNRRLRLLGDSFISPAGNKSSHERHEVVHHLHVHLMDSSFTSSVVVDAVFWKNGHSRIGLLCPTSSVFDIMILESNIHRYANVNAYKTQ